MPEVKENLALPVHLRFFRAAVIYLLIGGSMGFLFSFEPLRSYTHGTTAVSTHIILIFFGWVTMTIMGAMSKMAPTMIGRDLHSEDWGGITYWFMNIGIIGYSAMLIFEELDLRLYWVSLPLYYANINFLFVSFIIVASMIFAYSLYKTIGFKTQKLSDPSIGLSLNFYRVSTAYFVLSIIIAVLAIFGLTADVFSPLRFADVLWVAPFTTLGWITLTIMGTMYNLLPTLTLSKIPNLQLARFQFWTMNIGIVCTSVASLLGVKRIILEGVAVAPLSILQTVGVVFVGVGAVLFLYIMALTILTRKRKELNISLKFYIAALFYFAVTMLFGVWLKTEPGYLFSEGTTITIAHGLLSTTGFVTLTIMGSMYFIPPMWTIAQLQEKSKNKPPPTLTQMYNEKLARLSFWLSTIGVAGYIAGLIGEGYVTATLGFAAIENIVTPYRVFSGIFIIVLAVGVLLFANNIWKILSPLKRLDT